MTKKELQELNSLFIQLANFGNTKFKYAVLKNIEILKSNVFVLTNLEGEIKKYLDSFNTDRNNLILKLGNENENGSVSIDTKNLSVMEEFQLELNKLVETHKLDLETYNSKMIEFQDILNEEIEEELSFKQLSIDVLPEDGISIQQLDLLERFNIIKE